MKKTKKRVLLYSPYIDILGGGERHIISILKVFDDLDYQIDIAWDNASIKKEIVEKLHLKFNNLTIIPNFLLSKDKLTKFIQTSKYSHFFYVTDGSYFFSRARHNYIFAMYPKKSLYNMKFINRIKLFNYSIISNSEFTAKYIDRWFGKKPHVIHPYIDDVFFQLSLKNTRKEKIILTVGRFFEHLHSKRQDVLIKSFKKLKQKDKTFKDFKLIVAGGLKEKEDEQSLKKLKLMAGDRDDISFMVNIPFNTLVQQYKKALIYWHAAGYDVNETKTPERVEHLGITPLEAMASKCAVFCHNSGGPKRLIREGYNGFLYDNMNELIEKTSEYVSDPKSNIIDNEYEFAKNNFSYESFKKNVMTYFNL